MKKKWGIIDYLVIATIIIILLATSWTEKGKWILSSVLIISLTSTFLTNKTIKIIIAILLLIFISILFKIGKMINETEKIEGSRLLM